VDADTLGRLTERDLVDIGVKSIGHRRRLLAAITRLGESPRPATAASAEPGLASPSPAQAEQRQMTVLYCQLVDAAEGGSDPETLRDTIRGFHQTCTALVAEYDGHVANFYGDCMLAYFGWPRAHEDDAERAVRAGLALVDRIRTRLHDGSGEPIHARVGISTGTVVVGDLIREGPAQRQSAVGLAPNVGARVLDLAGTGRVVVDELTCRLLGPGFAVHPLGRHALKGVDQPMAAYEIRGEPALDSGFESRGQQALATMVGRDQELALLLQRWAQVCSGEGTAVLLVGEAGIGKSRIARALLDACATQPHWPLRWQCSPYHTGSALWPVIQRLAHEAGMLAQDTTDTALDKLEALALANRQALADEAAALYAKLLGLDGSQRYGPLEMTPQMLRERTLELMAEQLFDLASQRPLLLVVEDAHWIDPTTLELIERCLEQIEHRRMLILITSRPDNQPVLAAHASVTRLSLNRLGRASVESIAARLAGSHLQAPTLATIVAQADGVPLFVEELTKAVLETGEAAVPASLQGSLMARLDRIPEVKEIAQIAACIGREFDQALLLQIAERPDAVAPALEQLVAAELIFRRGGRVNPRFVFKHALLQEAAYDSLLRRRRQALHARILQALEEPGQTPHEILAHHAERAGRIDQAIACWGRAGDAALAKPAYAEAADDLQRAIRLIADQTDGVDRRGRELELQAQLGLCHMGFHGSGSELTQRAYSRAHALLDAEPGTGRRLRQRVHYGLWASRFDRSDLNAALQLATAALAAEKADGTAESVQFAHRLLATSLALRGDFDRAQDHFDCAMALTDSARRSELSAQFGFDPAIATLYYYAWASAIQGHVKRSDELAARTESLCDGQPQVFTRTHAHLLLALRAASLRDEAAVARHAEALADLGARHGVSRYDGYVDVLGNWDAIVREPTDRVVSIYRRGIDRLDTLATRVWVPFFMGRLATGLAAAGRQDEALATVDLALAQCEQAPQGWCDAELWRVRATLQRDRDEAVRCLERALTLARMRGAKLWELRAAVSLARLWMDDAADARAADLLRPICREFEGPNTRDMVEARALLEQLDGRASPEAARSASPMPNSPAATGKP
ncbi:MAG TPA: AAA family ATPase, partial [Burkholderiaceae bacterium]